MPEVSKEIVIKHFKHEYACEECWYELNLTVICNYTGQKRSSMFDRSKSYEHECPRCESSFWLSKKYPYTEARECEF